MKARISSKSIQSSAQIIAALKEKVNILEEQLALLQEQYDWLKNQVFGRKTEQTSAITEGGTQLSLFQDEKEQENTSSDLRTKLEQIPGLDYETALRLAGGYEELLRETVGIIASECDEKIGQMCDCISSEDWKGYELITHSIKGLMASLGLKEVSERAKKHEYAAIEQDDVFIRSDSDAFIEAYREVCARLSQT